MIHPLKTNPKKTPCLWGSAGKSLIKLPFGVDLVSWLLCVRELYTTLRMLGTYYWRHEVAGECIVIFLAAFVSLRPFCRTVGPAYIRLENFLVPMQYTGNSGWFPLGKRAAIERRYPDLFYFLCAVFSYFHTTGCEAYSFTTDGYGNFNMRTNVGACRTHEWGVRHKPVDSEA